MPYECLYHLGWLLKVRKVCTRHICVMYCPYNRFPNSFSRLFCYTHRFQNSSRNVIYKSFHFHIFHFQQVQHLINIFYLLLDIDRCQLVCGLVEMQSGKPFKWSKPCPKYRISTDPRVIASDHLVAGFHATTIRMSNDTDLFDRVVGDASDSICENRNCIIVREVKLTVK